MSRTDVLDDAGWAQAHLKDPTVVPVEVDEDVVTYDPRHLAGSSRLDRAAELQQAGARDLSCKGDGSQAWGL